MASNAHQGRCPIDFDQHSEAHAKDWPGVYQNLREQNPRAWTDNYGGFWVATRYRDILKIAQRPESFSTAKLFDPSSGAPSGGVSIPPVPGFRGIPNETDPPEWKFVRDLLNPLFGPRAAEARRERTRTYATALIDRVIESGHFDVVDDFTSPLPGLVTMDILGLPLREWRRFAEPIHTLAFLDRSDPRFAQMAGAFDDFRDRVDEEIALRRLQPQDDLFGYLAAATHEGEPLAQRQIQDMCFNILAGGVDTTTAWTSWTLYYLATHPDLRQRLIDEPALLPHAREEFLRYVTPLHGLARTVSEDVQIDGWNLQQGDRVLLAYSSANRDPEVFEDPETVKLDRSPNRHIAFGAGIHRCLGSFVARMMFEVMISEVLARIPDYKVFEGEARPYRTVGGVNGWINIPAAWLW
jgi:cytochrome P450